MFKFFFVDFMSLELRSGFPTLLLNYGSGTIKSVVSNKKLSDGHLHSISILLTNKVNIITAWFSINLRFVNVFSRLNFVSMIALVAMDKQ